MISLLEDKQKGKFGVFVKCEYFRVIFQSSLVQKY